MGLFDKGRAKRVHPTPSEANSFNSGDARQGAWQQHGQTSEAALAQPAAQQPQTMAAAAPQPPEGTPPAVVYDSTAPFDDAASDKLPKADPHPHPHPHPRPQPIQPPQVVLPDEPDAFTFWSRVTYSYVSYILDKTRKGVHLEDHDADYMIPDEMDTHDLAQDYEEEAAELAADRAAARAAASKDAATEAAEAVDAEFFRAQQAQGKEALKKRGPSRKDGWMIPNDTARALLRLHWTGLLEHFILTLVETARMTGSALLLREFLLWLQAYKNNRAGMSVAEGWGWAVGLFSSIALKLYTGTAIFWVGQLVYMAVQQQLMAAVHAKVLRLTTARILAAGFSTGQIVNLVTSDVLRFENGLALWSFLVAGPIQVIVVFILICLQLGVLPAIAGVSLPLLYIPLSSLMAKMVTKYRVNMASSTDERLRVLGESVDGALPVKLLTIEGVMEKRVGQQRQSEEKWLRGSNNIRALLVASEFCVVPVAALATFLTYRAQGGIFNTAIVFYVLTLLNLTRKSGLMFISAVQAVAELNVSLKRIGKFLAVREPAPPPNQTHNSGEGFVSGRFDGGVSGRFGAGAASGKFSEGTVGSPTGRHHRRGIHGMLASSTKRRRAHGTVRIQNVNFDWNRPNRDATMKITGKDLDATKATVAAAEQGNLKKPSFLSRLRPASDKTLSAPAATSDETEEAAKEGSQDQVEIADEGSEEPQAPSGPTLQSIEFHAQPGELVAIVGPTGSGKSTLLAGLMGELDALPASEPMDDKEKEMHDRKHKAGLSDIRGRIAFCAQRPWIVAGTVRHNILFYQKWNERLYDRVVHACCLEDDLANFPHGDQTELAEGGANLSGGQRARIALARACYTRPSVALLDDPLSAVDPKVANDLFERALGPGGLLDELGSTRLLVTHQTQFLPKCDTVMVLKSGSIMACGPWEQVSAVVSLPPPSSAVEGKKKKKKKKSKKEKKALEGDGGLDQAEAAEGGRGAGDGAEAKAAEGGADGAEKAGASAKDGTSSSSGSDSGSSDTDADADSDSNSGSSADALVAKPSGDTPKYNTTMFFTIAILARGLNPSLKPVLATVAASIAAKKSAKTSPVSKKVSFCAPGGGGAEGADGAAERTSGGSGRTLSVDGAGGAPGDAADATARISEGGKLTHGGKVKLPPLQIPDGSATGVAPAVSRPQSAWSRISGKLLSNPEAARTRKTLQISETAPEVRIIPKAGKEEDRSDARTREDAEGSEDGDGKEKLKTLDSNVSTISRKQMNPFASVTLPGGMPLMPPPGISRVVQGEGLKAASAAIAAADAEEEAEEAERQAAAAGKKKDGQMGVTTTGMAGAGAEVAGTVPTGAAPAKLVEDEERVQGGVSWSVYGRYCRLIGLWAVASLLVLFLGSQAVYVAFGWWLANWTKAPASDQGETSWMWVLALLVGLTILSMVGRSMLFFRCTTSASTKLHSAALVQVLHAPLSFFHVNPSGRIMNRFSKDLGRVDDQLPQRTLLALQYGFQVLSTVALVAIALPVVLGLVVPLAVYVVYLRSRYVTGSVEIERLEAKSRAPIASALGASLKGLETIRAFHTTTQFHEQYLELLSVNASWVYADFAASRWLAFRLDSTSTLTATGAIIFAMVLRNSVDIGILALALSDIMNLVDVMSFFARQTAVAANQMTSVERLVQYTNLESENEPSDQEALHERAGDGGASDALALPAGWPRTGELRFEGLTACYRPGLPSVLRNLTLTLKAGTTCGVVGRTGSGKSSLMLAVFRLITVTSGTVYLDGVDTGKIKLALLRQRLSIIPQDPILFSGDLRSNLDPHGRLTDQEMWEALEAVQLKAVVSGMQGGLDAAVAEGGRNFSLGQRQLLCVARALLQGAKVLALDEATANLDSSTDEIIQKAVYGFVSDSASESQGRVMMTIAHRIGTVMGATNVLVLDKGQLMEFGAPTELAEGDGVFADMVAATRRNRH